MGCGILNAFIEHHADIRAERALNFNGFLRRKQVLTAVQVGAEAHAFVRDFAKFRKTVED